jgi:2',3'-cyclic-nucleotide 2'-phosphodiesterase (5'-nucleotidase family)
MKFQSPLRALARRVGPVLVLAGLAGCTIQTEQPVLEGTVAHLGILRTSDIHSRLFPYDLKPNTHDQEDGLYTETAPYGGLERIAGLIQRERQVGDRILYLDSGDIFQGAPIFNYGQGEPEFRWQSTIMADAVVVGNHEFDAGAANLARQAASWINYPFLAANYIFEDWTDETRSQLGRSIQPYTILNAKGLRIGVIGMGDIGSMYSITQGGNSTGITPLEANETVRAYVDFLHPAVDLIIVLSHLGLTEDQELTNGHEIYLDSGHDLGHFTTRARDPWVRMECPECRTGIAKYWVPGVRGIDIILGGHLHVLTGPPMIIRDPAGREVLLEHPGAFAKFMTRLDVAIAVPRSDYRCDAGLGVCVPEDAHFSNQVACSSDADCTPAKLAPYGAEVVAHHQTLYPVDTIWCASPRPADPYDQFFVHDAEALQDACATKGHGPTRRMLEPFRVQMEQDPRFNLTQIFGYAPKTVLRKNPGSGGDSALGNMTTVAMMIRKRVEAEFCVTNTLGIRDNFYQGLIDMETVFNVFPFENTITVMYLSGREIQEMFDFVTERSGGRGCQSQAQIAGCSFVMNCGQALRNDAHYPCASWEDCCQHRPEICDPDYEGTASWECNQGSCYAHPAEDIFIGGQPLNPDASYKMATNDYIANGGSGFNVLRRNTTKVYTEIAMRDALVEYLRQFKSCNQVLASNPNEVDPFTYSFCQDHTGSDQQRDILVKGACTCGDVLDFHAAGCNEDPPANPADCQQAMRRCSSIGTAVIHFCQHPLDYPIIVGEPDGRITRKVN